MERNETKPLATSLLLLVLFFQGLSGLTGGFCLIIDPTGELINLKISLLNQSPFSSYLIPGFVLFVFLGILPLIVFFGLLKKLRIAWYGSLLSGLSLIIWIFVEIIMIGFLADPPLQLIYGIISILILVFTLLPSVKNFYLKK
ncbi:MAG TPA: hypothetical protein VKA26_01590 [Ignavibacteriaceae bacterium]|nr:hypothetical protein [Ignavibacteriaceae bacterium]